MLDFLVLIISILGTFLFTLALTTRWLWPSLHHLDYKVCTQFHALLIFIPISWFLSLGLRGIVTMWAYYLDVPNNIALYITGGVGLVGCIVGYDLIPRAIHKWRNTSFHTRVNLVEGIVCFLIFILLIVHAYRAIGPWIDSDEMTVYGFKAKLIGLGYTYSDMGIDWRTSLFIESSDAPALQIAGDTYIVRALRMVNIIMCGAMVFAFLRCFIESRTWSLLSVAAFLATPEFIFLGTSLKADSTVMCFELAALLLAALAASSLLQRGSEQQRSLIYISLPAAMLSLLAVGSRPSGIYVAFVVNVLNAYLILRYMPTKNEKTWLLLLVFIVGGLSSAKYLFNFQIYGNPLYPFKGPWPLNAGDYTNFLPKLQEIYNLQGLPPIIEQIYLIIHLALGLEDPHWEKRAPQFLIDLVPHAKHRGVSLGWLSPALLAIYVTPLFWRKSQIVTILSILFLFLFTVWSLGIQYGRVFMSGSALIVVIAGIISSSDRAQLSRLTYCLQFCVRGILWGSVIALAYLSLFKWTTMWPHDINSLYSQNARIQSNLDLLHDFGGHRKEQNPPSMTELDIISKRLSEIPKARVLPITFSGRTISILFSHGWFGDTPTFAKDGSAPEGIDAEWIDHDCALINREFSLSISQSAFVVGYFPQLLFESQSKNWHLRCR
jgi:hypothetical protein